MSFEIVRHAFVMVFGNLRDSIRVSALPLLVTVVATLLLPALFGLSPADISGAAGLQAMLEGQSAEGSAPLVGLLLALLYFFAMSWIAVGWHRFILLEEYPRMVPRLQLGQVLGYLGRSFVIGLVVVLVGVPIGLLGGLAAGPFAEVGGLFGVVVSLFVIVLMASILTYVWLRLGLILPAVAVDKPMPLLAGWQVSGPIAGTIFSVSLILVALTFGIRLTVLPLLGGVPVVGQPLTLAVSWTTFMVGASILTTLYGHLVEKRDLV